MQTQPRSGASAPAFEPRWPVALAILVVLVLISLLPQRIRILPVWTAYTFGAVVLVPIAGVGLSGAAAGWLRAERVVTVGFFVIGAMVAIGNIASLIYAMIHRSEEVTGLQLLTSSIAVWVVNVLVFALLYWQLDRGGPEARINGRVQRPDWMFPQETAPEADVRLGWSPRFVDYLFLAYSTCTAFSATDALPLTPRAKLLMMFESLIALVTLVGVGARAINILGN